MSTLTRLNTGLQAALRQRASLSVESYRLMKAQALSLALADGRKSVTELDARAALLAWRAHLLQLLALYLAYGTQGEGQSDRLVHDLAQCETVLGADGSVNPEVLRLQRLAEAELRKRS